MDPVKEYIIEHEAELANEYALARLTTYHNYLITKFDTTDARIDFATNRADFIRFAGEQMRRGAE